MDLPPSAAPRRRAPPQGRLCGRSPASSERRRVASLVPVPAGAPVSVARPRPRPKGTTAPGKPAPCVSRASPDPGRRPSTRRTVRPRRGPGAGGTRRQPSPARPAVAGYGISPRSRCGLPEPRHCIGERGRPVHNPEPDIAGFAPQRSGPPRPAPALGTGRFRCYTADRVDSFVGHVPLFPRDSAARGGFPLSPLGNRGTGPPDRKGRRGRGESPPEPRRPPLFNLDTTRRTLRHPRGPVQSSPPASRPGCTRRTPATSRGRCSTPERRRSGRDRRGRLPDSWLLSSPAVQPRLNRGRRQPAARRDPLIRSRHGHSFAASRTIPERPVAGAAWQPRRPPPAGTTSPERAGEGELVRFPPPAPPWSRTSLWLANGHARPAAVRLPTDGWPGVAVHPSPPKRSG